MFGRVSRVYLGRDRETGTCKGFVFRSCEDNANAQKAINNKYMVEVTIISFSVSDGVVSPLLLTFAPRSLSRSLEPRPDGR